MSTSNTTTTPAGQKLGPPAVDLSQVKRFLHLLDPQGAFSFQTFDDTDQKRHNLISTKHGTLEQHVNALERLNQQGAGVFVTINTTDLSGRSERHIRAVRALFVDADNPDAVERVLRATSANMPPSIAVQTSPGRAHFYWRVKDVALADFSKLQKALIARFGTDRAVNDLPRVMRLPGFVHRKGAPHLVRFIEDSTSGRTYTAADLVQGFGLLPMTTVVPAATISTNPALQKIKIEVAKAFANMPPTDEFSAGVEDPPLDLDNIRAAAHALPVAHMVNGVPPLSEEKQWKQVAMAMADAAAEHYADTEALYQILDEISRQPGAGNYDPADNRRHFDRFVLEAQQRRANGLQVITPGSLFHMAKKSGWPGPSAGPPPAAAPATVPKQQRFFEPITIVPSSLESYRFTVGGLAQRGLVSLLAAAGGASKTTFLMALAVCAAAGRKAFGTFPLDRRPDGAPLRVAFVAGEERQNDLNLLAAGAATALSLSPAEQAALQSNLVVRALDHGAWRLGQPRLNAREDIAPETEDVALAQLRDAVVAQRTDLLILDPFAALTAAPNENDNAIIADLLMRLARLATLTDCGVIVAHHISKMTRETAASLRAEGISVRGASAFIYNVRVALSITHLTDDEIKSYGLSPQMGAMVRRLDRPKANNLPPMPAAFFKVIPVQVPTRTGQQEVRAVEWMAPLMPAVERVQNQQLARILAAVHDGFEFDPQNHAGVRVGYTSHHRGGERAIAPVVTQVTGLSEGEARKLLGRLMTKGLVIERPENVPAYNKARQKSAGTAHKRLDLTPVGIGMMKNWSPGGSSSEAPADEHAQPSSEMKSSSEPKAQRRYTKKIKVARSAPAPVGSR